MQITTKEKMTLTSEQELCLRTDRNLSVMANAGSGKTFVLVQRFIKIIDEINIDNKDMRIDPSRVLAITFTKKAAAEMKKKIINTYDKELSELELDGKASIGVISNLKRIREGLSYANISTIHSFCSSLLRQFPIEAGIPVNFSEMNEAERMKLIEQSIDSTMDFLLNSNNASIRNKMKLLLAKFERKQLKTLVQSILNKIELFDDFEYFFGQSDEEIKQFIIHKLEDIYHFKNMIIDIQELIQTLYDDNFLLSEKNHTQTYRQFYDAINRNANTILSLNQNNNNYSEICNFISAFNEINKICFTKTGKPNSRFYKIASRSDTESLLEQYSELVVDARKGEHFLQSLSYIDEYLKTDRILWEFVKEVQETNEDAKQYLNELDFDDLQLRVRELLKNKDVVDKIRSQIDYIMIDEFQDTNKLQYEIVKSLIPEITEQTINKDDINLFIVGDPKQSIYGFRNADVSVFYTAVNDICNYNSMLIEQGKLDIEKPEAAERTIDNEELLGKNRLTSTFRLRAAVAAFVNLICERIMSPEKSAYEVEYTQLVCSKDTDNIKLDENNNIIPSNQQGELIFLLSKREKDKEEIHNEANDLEIGEKSDNIQEEKLIANFIKHIKNKKDNNYSYSDFAILSRAKSNFPKLGKVLADEGIPFKVHSGNAFYETEEIMDFSSFLNFIYNPDNDIALLSILRAPFFNIQDTVLFNLKSQAEQKTFWQNLKKYAEEKPESNLSETYSLLNDILAIAPSMSISQVILLIIEKTGWSGLIEHKPNRHQKMANIDKLIEIARSFEDTGFKNIYDFVEELKFITDNQILESEAAVLTDENAVNIMSIHGAKGLQFPVVIIYNTNKKTGRSDTFTVSEEFGPGFSLKLENKDMVIKQVDSTINLMNKIITKEKETAEDKRVLYVAMTRAEDILAISVHTTQSTNGSLRTLGQMKLISQGLGIDNLQELFDETNELSINTKLDIRKQRKVFTTNFNLNIRRFFEHSKEEEVEIADKDDARTALILIDDIPSKQTYGMFSPSKFSEFFYNKQAFFDRYILGLPDDFIEKNNQTSGASEDIAGNIFGTAIHYTLENIEQWLNDDFSINEDVLQVHIDNSLGDNERGNLGITKATMRKDCINISQTPLIRREYHNIIHSKAEYELSMPLDGNILHGIIDLLLEKGDGSFEVWDWKSNIINSAEEKSKTAEHYELQMRIYCYFISQIAPEQNEYTARLLFTRLAGKSQKDDDWTHRFVWTKKEIEQTPEIINEIIEQMGSKLINELF